MRVSTAVLVLIGVVLAPAARTHEIKGYDQNGGHYDDGGFYPGGTDGAPSTVGTGTL